MYQKHYEQFSRPKALNNNGTGELSCLTGDILCGENKERENLKQLSATPVNSIDQQA